MCRQKLAPDTFAPSIQRAPLWMLVYSWRCQGQCQARNLAAWSCCVYVTVALEPRASIASDWQPRGGVKARSPAHAVQMCPDRWLVKCAVCEWLGPGASGRMGSSVSLSGIARLVSRVSVLRLVHLVSRLSMRSLARLRSSSSIHVILRPSYPWAPACLSMG